MDRKDIIILCSITAVCELLIFSVFEANKRRKIHNMIYVDRDFLRNYYCPHLRCAKKEAECLENCNQEKGCRKS